MEPANHALLRKEHVAFYGYTPFPPVTSLHSNFSGLTTAFRSLRLCSGASRDDLLYLVDIHYGYTPRGPLNFHPGLYVRNGVTNKEPVLAAAGDETRLPVWISTFSLESVILLPPVDLEAKNPTRDLVEEILRASTTSTAAAGTEGNGARHVTFRFAIEVGVKMREREEFEWVDANGLATTTNENGGSGSSSASAAAGFADTDTPTKGHRFVLLRCPRPTTISSPSSSAEAADDLPEQGEILAELVFANVIDLTRIFTLELKGAGLTGELGDRWTLMVVMTALRIYWLRTYGKTGKAVIWAGEKVRGL
ncbi:hypothetical protein QBC37DRAFT_406480 [Rhypophila decipiens]|uniref:Uncharacterized protein n=1 Tax=Rhypophila decipiens TaxID=261697 RepID=A0AAN6XUI6_9PEZI|nr:hypothetical protein QBC37DRAFT_406480 [Rhypophila decipiens]